jgi:hypothetical protein
MKKKPFDDVNNRVSGVAGAGWQDRHDWFNIDVPAE